MLVGRGQLKCDGTRAETRFRLSEKRSSPFKSAGGGGWGWEWSVQWTTGSRGVRISGSNAGYTMFRGSVKGTGYPLHSSFSPSLPLPCVTMCHHISIGVYISRGVRAKCKLVTAKPPRVSGQVRSCRNCVEQNSTNTAVLCQLSIPIRPSVTFL